MTRPALSVLVLAAAASLAGCGKVVDCDAVSTAWAGDAETFFGTYCVSCHSTQWTGDDRGGAPEQVNFDTYSDFLASETFAVYTQLTEGLMPPDGYDQPSEADRARIADWAYCGGDEQ